MAETRIAFLYKAASMLPATNKTLEKIKSYYRMRCKEVSRGYGLPQKHFSEQIMCTHCCLEWRKGTAIKVNSIKLSKRQRKRIKSRNKLSKQTNKEHLLHSNEVEQICTFCKHSTKTVVQKPNKPEGIKSQKPVMEPIVTAQKIKESNNKKNTQACDVYSSTGQVFSLNNKKNTLKSSIKETKVIKNNKKKKDKFAGLCQKAVMMSAQLKQTKDKQNKLSLFLKPSS